MAIERITPEIWEKIREQSISSNGAGSQIPVNDGVIDLFFDGPDAGTFKKLRAEKTEIVLNTMDLSYGNISDLHDPYSRREDYLIENRFYVESDNYCVSSRQSFITEGKLDLLKTADKTIRVWASYRSSNELCGFLFLMSEMRGKNNIARVRIPVCRDSERYDGDVDRYFCGNSQGELRLFTGTEEEMNYYYDLYDHIVLIHYESGIVNSEADKWDEFVQVNADLRVFDDDVKRIRNFSYSDFYGPIIEFLGNGEDIAILIADYFYYSKENRYSLNKNQIRAVISDMIKKGVLEKTGKKDYYGKQAYIFKVRQEYKTEKMEDPTTIDDLLSEMKEQGIPDDLVKEAVEGLESSQKKIEKMSLWLRYYKNIDYEPYSLLNASRKIKEEDL